MALIGTHVSISGGIEKAFTRADEVGCEAMQIFSKNQLQWRSAIPTETKCLSFQRAWKESRVKEVVIHSSYLVNLAAGGELQKKSIRSLVDEITSASLLGIDLIVVHPGSHGGNGESLGLENISSSIRVILERTADTNVRILLETMAGQGHTLGYKLEHFNIILDKLDWNYRIGFCIDTSHIYAAGYDIRTKPKYQGVKKRIDRLIGLDRVFCWHLNDSKREIGSRVDRHEHIGSGYLGLHAFSNVINDPIWSDTPCILETPKSGIGDKGNLEILRKLRGY